MHQNRIDARKLARDRWPEILVAAGVKNEVLRNIHSECPICGSGGKKWFRFDDKEGRGTYFCNGCGAGDGYQFLMAYMSVDFKTALDHVQKVLDAQPVTAIEKRTAHARAISQAEAKKMKRKRAALCRVWEQSRPILKGDTAWNYLCRTRKLPIKEMPRCLRLHPRLAYTQEVVDEHGEVKHKLIGYFPAITAKVVNPDNKSVTLHRTYLTPDGKKAPVEKPKKLMESLGVNGGAIRLMPHGETLGVAEGIESAFAAYFLTKVPTWATVSSTIMQNFVPPEGVKNVVIFADNDLPDAQGRRAGQHAAELLKQRLEAMGISVKVKLPARAGTDFHDVWLGRLAAQVRKVA